MMNQGLLQWSPCRPSPSLLLPLSSFSPSISIHGFPKHNTTTTTTTTTLAVSATLESVHGGEQLTAKERRQLRNERRENKAYNWREEVEERLMKKPKKRYASWTEELNLDNLALLGPQWWVVRVSRVSGQDTSERLARALVRNYPEFEFKVYVPSVQVKRKLKNGTISVKPKSLFPGCVFLRCVLNKEMHDFIREIDGVGGFVGSKVGNTKRQINRPKPVSDVDIEAIFRQAKKEQEDTNRAFEEDQRKEAIINTEESDINSLLNVTNSVATSKPKRRTKKSVEPLVSTPSRGSTDGLLVRGSSVRVVSGPFTEFTGRLKKLDHKAGKATVGFMLFGKESLVDIELNQIVAET